TLVDPASVWALAYVDEARAGPVKVGQRAEVRLRSLPQYVFPAKVERIGIESDRVSEERRVFVKCDQCPERFHLGEQAEILITVATLERATLVPEAAVDGFDGHKGRIWGVKDGALHQYEVTFGHRTADARLEIVEGLPKGAQAVTRTSAAMRDGRRAWVGERQAK
ncbi:MAG TPA: HlyD family efflux transporter periplasmic adaptor subunit, partial [Rhizobiales bacterium]|nr:HlyD family efflux transporter periplasmic adaptor subunit [Hyphomicrobiales bacterium]